MVGSSDLDDDSWHRDKPHLASRRVGPRSRPYGRLRRLLWHLSRINATVTVRRIMMGSQRKLQSQADHIKGSAIVYQDFLSRSCSDSVCPKPNETKACVYACQLSSVLLPFHHGDDVW